MIDDRSCCLLGAGILLLISSVFLVNLAGGQRWFRMGAEGHDPAFGWNWYAQLATTSAGQLIFHVFGAPAEFERNLIRERTPAGLLDNPLRIYPQ